MEPPRGGLRFGLAVAVRTTESLSSVPGNPVSSPGRRHGTQLVCDPKDPVVVVGTAAPGELPQYYREQVQDIV